MRTLHDAIALIQKVQLEKSRPRDVVNDMQMRSLGYFKNTKLQINPESFHRKIEFHKVLEFDQSSPPLSTLWPETRIFLPTTSSVLKGDISINV